MNATTTPPAEGSCPSSTLITKQIIPVLYFVVFVAGILLNGMSGWLFFYVPSSKSFIVYLKNIVIADFLMSLTFPFKILLVYAQKWDFWIIRQFYFQFFKESPHCSP